MLRNASEVSFGVRGFSGGHLEAPCRSKGPPGHPLGRQEGARGYSGSPLRVLRVISGSRRSFVGSLGVLGGRISISSGCLSSGSWGPTSPSGSSRETSLSFAQFFCLRCAHLFEMVEIDVNKWEAFVQVSKRLCLLGCQMIQGGPRARAHDSSQR